MRSRSFVRCFIGAAVAVLALTAMIPEPAQALWPERKTERERGSELLEQSRQVRDAIKREEQREVPGFSSGTIHGRIAREVRLFPFPEQWEAGSPKTRPAGKQRPPRKRRWGVRTLRPGFRGGEVSDLQGRLKFLGFYTGKVNGIYTWRTYRAVRLFQYAYGLRVDGIAGSKTRAKLWEATRNWRFKVSPRRKVSPLGKRVTIARSSHGLSRNDLYLLAHTVYAEGRGEPYIGQVAIAAVILNRLKSDKFPHTIPGIVFQPMAFESVADGQIWLNPDKKALKACIDALNGWDPSSGALYYFNPARATSKWIWSRPQIKRIGKHIFMK